MTEISLSHTEPAPASPPAEVPLVVRASEQLDAVLAELNREQAPSGAAPPVLGPQVDNHLIQVRLGIASSLFAALRCRCAATASHALRVALSCSLWANRKGMEVKTRDEIEVAALLHDVGVIGVPDQILLKPGPLSADEAVIFDQSRRTTAEILRHTCAEPRILEAVENVSAWFDGSRGGFRVAGPQIPLGARMIAIAEAFDAMTTDQVFRRATSEERALRELFAFAGRQFDSELVREFAELCGDGLVQLRREAARRWLQTLDPESGNSYWELGAPTAAPRFDSDRLFEMRLLDNMHDAVVFIDPAMRIVQWNHGAERLTGILAPSICDRVWSPTVLNMQNERGDWVTDDDCPVRCTLSTRTQSLRRLTICGRGGRPVPVDSHAIPVATREGNVAGVVLLLHDASSEISLEARCQSLHEKATRDPLTQIANRAEFDRVHEMFVNAHREQQIPCALIMCDLDHFKLVNDTYGHQAGDEVIKSLANLLRTSCRSGDLVARYGGEEFVMLCADCGTASAANRAEKLRVSLSRIAQPKLEGRSVTASFGVTEIQPGDTPETMLRRADRALFMAKEKGRNRVVQLGAGPEDTQHKGGMGTWWQREELPPLVVEQDLVTPVPIAVAIEKLRGFVADHRAKILKIEGNRIQLEIDSLQGGRLRRASDRPVAFRIDLEFKDELVKKEKPQVGKAIVSRTCIHLKVKPARNRDRRRADIADRAREIMASFRSYLVATPEEPEAADGVLRRASRILTPWLLKR